MQSADVGVADIRNLFQDQFLDFRLGELLQHVARARVEQEVVADAEPLGQQRIRHFGDAFLVGAQGDHDPMIVQRVLEPHHLALDIEPAGLDDVQRLVQDHFLALAQGLDVDGRMEVDF